MVVKAKPIKKSYTTSTAMADEVTTVSNEMGVPESSIINFALRAWLINYRREQSEVQQPSLKSVA
jgi:hypothetical protein